MARIGCLGRLSRAFILCLQTSVICATVLLFPSSPARAQSNDLTVNVLVNSTNATGYNTSSSSPGEYQRYPERYLENLQIPYRVLDVSITSPPANLSSVQLIIAGHRGLNLNSAWQQAIISAVASGVGFMNLDWDPAICGYPHVQAIFGCASSTAGTPGTSITVPATFLSDGATPHYITGLQMRFPIGMPSSAYPNDLVYLFHADDSGAQGTATSTVLLNSSGVPISTGTVLAKIGNDPFLTVVTYGQGRAVHLGTYDYLRADRFGFVMGLDDVFWRSLVWAARKPFVVRGYPRLFAIQQDDPVDGWFIRVGDMFNPTYTGAATTQTLFDGSKITVGGPWKVTGNIQNDGADFEFGSLARQTIINYLNGGYLKIGPHTNTGGSDGDFYWAGPGPNPLTDSQWLANYNNLLVFQQGAGSTGSFNGTSDFLPFTTHVIPHFWDFSNNVGHDLWQLGVRYITAIQKPGVYYSGPAKTPSQRMPGLHPFRVYEQPPTGVNPNELYSFFWADNYTIGSRMGFPAVTFFGFATQLQGMGYSDFDARWPSAANGWSESLTQENWRAYVWRFWSGLDPVQVYNHDGGSMANGTDQERQQFISSLSPWLANLGSQNLFMEDMGAYLHARVNSTLTTAQATPSTITLNFTGNATDMNGKGVNTQAYVFFGNDNGALITIPGFTNGITVSVGNTTPPAIALSTNFLAFAAAPGGPNPSAQSISVSNAGTGNMAWSLSSSASWLMLAPTSGTNSGSFAASVNTSGMASGNYSATITVSAAGATNSPINVPVTLALEPPTLTVSPKSFVFAAFQGQGNPASRTLSITNAGSGTVSWTASSDATWLTLSASSGVAPSSVTVTPNISGLALGTYNANITITASGASGSPQTIPVTLALQGILLTEANFNLGTMDGLVVSPMGLGTNWSVAPGALKYNGKGATQLYAGNAAWTDYTFQATFQLSSLLDYPGGIRGRVNPASGAGYALWFYPNEKLVKLYRNVAWNIDSGFTLLAQGAVPFDTASHVMTLSFSGSQIQVLYDNQQIISVSDSTYSSGLISLDVSNQPITYTNLLVSGTSSFSSSLQLSTSSMAFSTQFQGPNPAAQNLTLSASGGALAWTATTNASWLSVSPSSGMTGTTLQVSANSQGLAGGTYTGQIRIVSLAAPNSPQIVNVTLTVVLPPPTIVLSPSVMSFTAVSGQAAPPAQALTISNPGSGTISWTATTDVPWLGVSVSGGSTAGQTSVSVNASGLALGSYTGHVTIAASGVANSPQVMSVNLRVLAQALSENFSNNAAGWVISPLGHANGWSVANNIYSYAGFGPSQSCTGNANWGDYVLDASIRLSSLSNYPGGIRARVNPNTGAGYVLFLYPGNNLVKLFRVGQWNIDSGLTVLAQAPLNFDTLNFHDARIDLQGSQINVYWDGTLIMSVTDTTYATGNICLDGSSQPISFNNVNVLANQAATTLSSSAASLSFAATGTGNPPSQTVSMTAGSAITDLAVTSNAAWLTASSSSSLTPATLTVSVNATGLSVGTYNGALTVSAPGATNSPLIIPVTLSVQAGLIAGAPSSLLFFGAVGFSPESQNLAITNQGTGQIPWSASTGASWDALSVASGTTPATLAISPNVVNAGLGTGTYSDTVTITSSQTPNTVSVPVTLNVGTLLFSDNFSAGAGNWTVSPLGSAVNWSAANGIYSYSGAGVSNSSAGSQSFANYDYAVDFKLASLNDFPGGIRGRVNLTSGAGYGAWIYPNEKIIKLYRIGQWNIDQGFALLATSSAINIDATAFHNLRLDFRNSTINVYFDNVLVATATDSTYAAGAIALDVSSQPIQFTNVVVIGF